MQRKKAFVVGILTVSIGLVLGSSLGYCTDAGDPYSARPTSSVQAWYDETWQASGFYRLTEEHPSTPSEIEYRYQEITNPTASLPGNPNRATFVKDSSVRDKTTDQNSSPPDQHTHSYKDATSGASLPQDIVITEWRVTGHVHFASGM